ncbi:hypothetical protein Cgig2_001393 [Carnegiea gigantea]|uniref:R13L1/DRL21-like LRR repeat region domain-containing protein n=1 Tax=Carnegiea gigantea TaxID=171969 RepID=A0A9Q1KUM6_9CARY|nr:hypothetical protein Cgig2_001393 [Carnegiea gigantea]
MALDFVSGFIVSSLLQELVERVRASVADTISLACSWNVKEELKDLEASYINVLSMLHNVDGWDLITSQPHQNWLGDVWRVCYKINDFTQLLRVEILDKIEDASFVTSLWTRWGVCRRQRDLQNELNRVISFATQYRNARHLSLLCQNISLPIWKHIEKCEGLRTILSLHERTLVGEISDRLFLKLQSLRVLHLRGTDITELPETIGTWKHLRFLDVSRTRIEELPSSIVDLHGLQVLKLDHCELLLPLPKGIENLTQLLHLEVDVEVLKSMPPRIGNLINLHTLPAFFVRRKDGYRITELKGMKYLQGSICLAQLQNIEDEAEAREAMLSNKPFLKRVELKWDRKSHDQSLAERILTSLKPHENLEELQVTGYDGAQFPGWLSNAECKLSSIQLLKCHRCRILPALGQLQHLVALHIEGMQRVEYVNHQFSGSGLGAGFPALELLKFKDMTSLTQWEGLQDTQMPRLRDLVIEGCSQLIALPSLNLLTSLVKLEVSRCPALQALPEQGLPFSLKELIIQRSDSLKQCCLPECQGTDWEKIRAVPEVIIDGVQMPTSAQEG